MTKETHWVTCVTEVMQTEEGAATVDECTLLVRHLAICTLSKRYYVIQTHSPPIL